MMITYVIMQIYSFFFKIQLVYLKIILVCIISCFFFWWMEMDMSSWIKTFFYLSFFVVVYTGKWFAWPYIIFSVLEHWKVINWRQINRGKCVTCKRKSIKNREKIKNKCNYLVNILAVKQRFFYILYSTIVINDFVMFVTSLFIALFTKTLYIVSHSHFKFQWQTNSEMTKKNTNQIIK